MLVLNALDFDLQSCMTSLTFLFIDIKILVMLPYIRSYFITTEFHTFNIRPSNINTRNNDPIQNNKNNKNNDNNSNDHNNNNNNNNNNKIIIIIIVIIMISTIIFQHITEKLENMTYFAFFILEVLLPPKV